MTQFALLAAPIAFMSIAGCGTARVDAPADRQPRAQKSMITLEKLVEMFDGMRADTKWDIDGEMLWGYFFTDPDPKKLERIVAPLNERGCRFVSIYETDDKSTHFLHVERVEKHTPNTLHALNAEFYKLAEEFDLESYDGMDVGPVKEK